jgi:uncharacterized membrane protein
MTKQEFLTNLQLSISVLPKEDVVKYIEYYSEMIDDRIEEGVLEEDAVNAIGSYNIIAEQILKDNGIVSPIKENNKNGDALKTTLIAVGSPIWVALMVVALAVAITVIVSAYAVLISLWACAVAFSISAVCGVIVGIITMVAHDFYLGITLLGADIALSGVAILFFIGCKYLTKGVIYLTNKLIEKFKSAKRGA